MKKIGWLLYISVVAFAFNWQFLQHTNHAEVMARNDVASIWAGYKLTPNLWRDGLAWWHGPWIYQGVVTFRPLTSYLHWFHCWVGESFG